MEKNLQKENYDLLKRNEALRKSLYNYKKKLNIACNLLAKYNKTYKFNNYNQDATGWAKFINFISKR